MPRWSEEPVTLDRQDTLHSARGKLQSSARGRPVVVLAANCKIAENVLTYRLLARASQELGSPIAVVSGNPAWRKLAREHGLRAFGSTGALERSRRHSAVSLLDSLMDFLVSSVNVSFPRQGWVILTAFLLAAAFALYLFLPVMKVTIQAPVQDISQDMTAKVDASVSSVDVSSSLVPGRIIEYRFNVSDTVSTGGDKRVGKDKAKGEVTVINSSNSLITIPAGTVLSAGDGQKFLTATSSVVGAYFSRPGTPAPAATASPSAGTSQKVPVIAMDPGEKGNVAALAISRFESDSFRSLTVFNEQPLAGGSDAQAKVATADDRSRLKESLFQRAQSQALSELQMRVRQSESLIPHSMQIRVEKEDYDKAVDEEADKLKGTLSVVATAIAFANADLNNVAEKQWKASIPKGFRPTNAALTITPPEVTQAGSQTASLKLRVSGRAERVVESDDLSQTLRGLSMDEAKSKLGRADGFRLMKVELWPDWAPKAYRVEVQTVQ
ncbi:MAG TPA: baseplate J/gp47 family protein [Chloroflexota bacterium]